MLRVLRIENLAVVASAEIEFGGGLNLLTGETGAGKSIVVDALGLVAGEKADSGLVRTGEERGTIEAIFDAPTELNFEDLGLGIDVSEGEVAVRREISPSGRSRATINGVTVPVSVLRSIGSKLVQINGQHQHHALMDPAVHLRLLDRFGGLSAESEAVDETWQAVQGAREALDHFRARAKDWARERDSLEFQVREIRHAALRAGEDEKLREERSRLRNLQRLRELASEVLGQIETDEGSVNARLRQAGRRVTELQRLDPASLSSVHARWAGASEALRDFAADIETYLETLDVDPRRADEVEARLSEIERLKKKYGSSIEEILIFCDTAGTRLEASLDPEARERELEFVLETRVDSFGKQAEALSKKRREISRRLEKEVAGELADLAMAGCRFAISFEPRVVDEEFEWGGHGPERAEFLLSANPGEELRPLGAVASGGELSRSLLALQSVIDPGSTTTVVFDEVDSGIGGGVAEAVGRRLSLVAGARQVLCVTHLAQVAAFADHHFVVEKRVLRGRTLTEVREVNGREREREVARMLAGETVTQLAEEHARALVERVRDSERGEKPKARSRA